MLYVFPSGDFFIEYKKNNPKKAVLFQNKSITPDQDHDSTIYIEERCNNKQFLTMPTLEVVIPEVDRKTIGNITIGGFFLKTPI